MPQLVIKINDRNYQISCQDGEEERVKNAASRVDEKIKKLRQNMTKASTELLYVTSLLMMEDNLADNSQSLNTSGLEKQDDASNEDLKKLLNLITEDLGTLVIPEK